MSPPYSKIASLTNAKMSSESSEKAESIRRSWTQQTSCNISSAEEFPLLSKTNTNTPKTDENKNHQVQKDVQFPDQACSSRSSPSFLSKKSRPVSVTPSQNKQPFKKGTVVQKPPDTVPVHLKPELIYSLVGLPMPRVSLEQALASAEQCPVVDKNRLVRLLSARTEEVGTTDDLLQRFQTSMEVVRHLGLRGVVHSLESEIKWIVLGEEEEQRWFGGVGSRTRQATRKIFGWVGEGEVREEKHSKDAQMGDKLVTVGAVNVSHDNIDCDSSFSEENWNVKKAEKASSREEGEISDEDWYRKPKPTSSGVSADSSYFNTFGKMTRSTLKNLVTIGNLTITAVAGNTTTADDEKPPAVECDKDEVEEVGTCPMCQKEMVMKELIGHASYCQG